MKHQHLFLLLFIIVSAIFRSNGQDSSTDILKEANRVKSIATSDAFDWGGNLSFDMRFNAISGIDRRADPFDFRLNGVVFATIYSVKTALNFNIADGKIIHRLDRPNVKLPSYAYLGMSPSYKWAKVHIGYRNLSFSPYTFNGTNFYGGGIELSPGNFRIKSFYGRLQRARPEIADIPSSIDPTYLRTGWGVQTGYKKGNDEIYLILFSAIDDENSIIQPIVRDDVKPMSNVISSIKGKKAISSKISLDWDYAWSGITRDIASPFIENKEDISFIYGYGGLYKPRISTGFHKALNTGINFSIKGWKWDIRHERVDPGYQSLGALFFNNDYENVTAGFNKAFFQKKLNITSRVGLQRNNLSGTENNSLRRIVGQVNANMRITNRWNLNISSSNFSNTNILRVSQLPIPENDSLILTQVNRNFQLNSTYIMGKEKNMIWNGFISHQQFNTITNDIIDVDKTVNNILFNVSNTYRFKNKTSLTNALNINQNIQSVFGFSSTTLSHAYSKSFLKDKLKTSFQAGNTVILSNSNFSKHLFFLGTNGTYKINENVDLGILLSFVNQTNNSVNGNSFREFNCRMRFKTKI